MAAETAAKTPERRLDPSGRELGPRALRTRQKLLEATAKLLAQRSVRDVSVVDIARAAGTSPATFYQYFAGVIEATLWLAERAADEGDRRFQRVRQKAMTPVMERLAEQVAAGQKAGRVDPAIVPQAAAAALGAILERLAAYHRELEGLGVSRDDLVETCARIVLQTVRGAA
jgi:AcrR family transcriptional regulator